MACFTSGVFVTTIEKFDDKLSNMTYGSMFGIDSFLAANCQWEMKLAVREPDKSYLSVGLAVAKRQSGIKQVMFDVCALDENGHKHYNVKDWSNVFSMKSGDNLVWKPFLPVTAVASLLSNNKFTVRCKIHLLTKGREIYMNNQLPPQSYRPLLPPKLGSDLTTVLENGSLSDVSLVVSGRTIPAHRVVLASRSSVFRAMFEHNMKEAGEGRVDISDCSYEAVAAMLKFMYCDIPPEFDDVSPNELLEVADKYDMPGLKRVCESEILRKLDVNNAAHTLRHAEEIGALFLKQWTLEYISVNLGKVMATEEWRDVTRSHPDVMEVVLNSAAQYIKALEERNAINYPSYY